MSEVNLTQGRPPPSLSIIGNKRESSKAAFQCDEIYQRLVKYMYSIV